MLSGETRGAGGRALARHLNSTADGQFVRCVEARFLAARSLDGQIAEMARASMGARTSRPILHIHVDPEVGSDRIDVIQHWVRLFEEEFGLQKHARAGVVHRGKKGSTRLHAHFVYSVVGPDNRVVDLRNSYRRREKVSVIVAHDLGLSFPKLPRPRAIHRALLKEGRTDVARWMVMHCPELREPVRTAKQSPQQRHIAERTGVETSEVLAAVSAAWPSPDARDFQRALVEKGFSLARGDKVVVLVDRTGTPHALARAIRQTCRQSRLACPSAADVREFLSDLTLPLLAECKRIGPMTKPYDVKSKILADVTGEHIVASYGDRTRYVKRGPPHRILMRDGGWVTVDSKISRLVVTGPVGDADLLAEELARVEPFEIHRQDRSPVKRRPHKIRPLGQVVEGDDRFEWWVEKGMRPERRAGGLAIEVGGTLLVDRGNEIEVHDLPPSDMALTLIAQYAAAHWGGGLELTGPPGSTDWSEKDKARLWWACQRAGVVYHGYTPSPALVKRWNTEHGDSTGLPGGAVALRPGDRRGAHHDTAATRVPNVDVRLAELDAAINNIKSQWRTKSRDQDWIERMRQELSRLEEDKAALQGPGHREAQLQPVPGPAR